MKKKVKTRKKITLQSVIMYILLILTALMFATPMLFTLLSSIKTKVEFCETILLAGSPAMVQLCGSLDKCQHESLLFKQFDSGRSDSDRTCDRVYNGSLRTVQI